ncbi:GAF domain-containing protein [Methylobacterium sp. J-090]|uniref:GAF domain-containing protein n=1 Tax=Methylobacterium sp. J-090 TaxID=2836666 RepID=UPI001FBC01DE|nr:GAF domain-containing protein [Methylobacterium sp. J-090]MCJ2079862.1 GAF domain-containing protein [Methylobacterium sp. J-090]
MPYPVVNEPARLQALHDLQILDTPPEDAFHRLTQAAKDLFDVPYALITFVDEDRAWIKTGWPVDYCESKREHSLCNYTILHETVLVVSDTLKSEEFRANPYVCGEPHLRFYAGAPLTIAPGIRVGALCLLDTKPRSLSASQVEDLQGLAQVVVGELWLRRALGSASGVSVVMGKGGPTNLRFSVATHVSSVQIRAARALLDWTIVDLAKAAQVSINTIKRLEDSESEKTPRATCVAHIRSTLEEAGVRFFDQSGVALSTSRRPR